MAVRCCMEAVGASTELSHHHFAAAAVDGRRRDAAILTDNAEDAMKLRL
jgi:hypothetical protein